MFHDLKPFNDKGKVKVADGFKLEVKGIGSCKIKLTNEKGEITSGMLADVLYVPDLKENFISIKKLNKNNIQVNFVNEKAELIKKNKIIATGSLKDDLFKLYAVTQSSNRKLCIHELHRILGHRNNNGIKQMLNENLVIGVELKQCSYNEKQCEICVISKVTRKSFKKEVSTRSTEILQLIHTDLNGPMRTVSYSKKRYVLTFVDDNSRFTKIYLLKEKSEVKDKLPEFVELVKTQFNKKPKKFNSDRGGEYVNEVLQTYLAKEGIQFRYTSPYTSELNGVAERKNRTLIEMVRCLLNEAKLPTHFWGEAVTTANRMVTTTTKKTPYELWFNKRPQLKYLQNFGAKRFVKVPDQLRHKLQDCAKERILLGYDEDNSMIYLCLSKENKIVISRDVVFPKDKKKKKMKFILKMQKKKEMNRFGMSSFIQILVIVKKQ